MPSSQAHRYRPCCLLYACYGPNMLPWLIISVLAIYSCKRRESIGIITPYFNMIREIVQFVSLLLVHIVLATIHPVKEMQVDVKDLEHFWISTWRNNGWDRFAHELWDNQLLIYIRRNWIGCPLFWYNTTSFVFSLPISGTRKTKPSAVEEITILINWIISLTVIHWRRGYVLYVQRKPSSERWIH